MTDPSFPTAAPWPPAAADDRPAIRAPGRKPLSHRELSARVGASARWLQGHGVGPDDRIALVVPNGPLAATTFLAAAAAGVAAPLNPAYLRDELAFYLGDLAPRFLLVKSDLDTPAREVATTLGIQIVEIADPAELAAGVFSLDGTIPEPGPVLAVRSDRTALVLHTSGTTSRPKQVPLSHGNLGASAAAIAATLGLGPADACLNVMPLFHIHGLMAGLLASLSAGGSVICTPGFLASRFADWLTEERPTWYTAVPTIHQAVLERLSAIPDGANRPGASLRFVRSSSAALPPRTMRELETLLGVPVIEAYGMTEAAHQMASNPLPPGRRKPGTVGPAAGPAIAIATEAGELLPQGEIGEVVIRGPGVTAGYVRNPDANAAAFVDGWFRTGDQGRLDEDGYLQLTGRLKELINRAGEKVAPLEVDAVLMEHPAVAQAISFGMPHPILGEDVAAAVVLHPGQSVEARALRGFVAGRLAYFKVPRQIRFVDRIPTGATGKLQRRGLAERLGIVAEVPVVSGDRTPPGNPTEEIVAAVWHEVLERPVPGIHENFFAIGGDSMLAARALARLRPMLKVNLTMFSLFDAPTVAALAAEIDSLIEAEGSHV